MPKAKLITRQEALDRNYQRFVVERAPFGYKKYKLGGGTCLYRHATNHEKKCGIGCLLPESTPSAVWNYDGPVGDLFSSYPETEKQFASPDSRFWNDLQNCHDSAAGIACFDSPVTGWSSALGDDLARVRETYMARVLKAIARKYRLKWRFA